MTLTHEDMQSATLPMSVFEYTVLTDKHGDATGYIIREVVVTEYNLSSGAFVPTLAVTFHDGRKGRASVSMFHRTMEDAEAEALACLKDSVPSYHKLERQRDELAALLRGALVWTARVACIDVASLNRLQADQLQHKIELYLKEQGL